MKTSIISIEDKRKWYDIVGRASDYDFHHCHSYNLLENTGIPFLFVVTDTNEDFIAMPLVKRPVPGTRYFDCTSVYGYPGPISSKPSGKLSESLVKHFQNELLQYAKQEHIIAAFTRMHPIIDQSPFFNEIGKVLHLNKTIAIDLTLPLEKQRQQYRKSNKSEINQLRRNGYTVKKADTASELYAFVDIYTETMKRVNAQQYYFFGEDYFREFLNVDDFSSFLLLAYKDNQIAAGAIFTATKNIMQYHLAGTREAYISDTPMKLILDEARLLGTSMGLQYLHLGGGVGGSDDDSLYRFKAGFSDLNFTYKVWQLIADEEKYQALVAEKQKTKELNPNYFPLYRG